MPERMLWGTTQSGYRAVVQTPSQTVPADIAEQADVDARAITRVLAGDREAFAVLVTKYSDPLYRHALNMTGSPDVAEDIMQALVKCVAGSMRGFSGS